MGTANEILPAFFLSDNPDEVLAAAAAIAHLSSGRVFKAEGMNRRTGKPERDGIYCAKVFGPVEDHRCLCGKLSAPLSAGEICDKCGVLCGDSRLRAERWGHIDSPAPLLHPRLAPRIVRVLGCSEAALWKVARYEAALDEDGAVRAGDPDAVEIDDAKGTRAIRRCLSGREDLLLSLVPLPPPAWRGTRGDPVDGAACTLINRCTRLTRLIELNAPEIILQNEACFLQQAFERLCTNARAEISARRDVRPTAPVDARSAELLQAIYDAPDDDRPRADYAAYLTAHGDRRGAFITAQLRGASRAKMPRAEADLLRRHLDAWLSPLGDAVEPYVVFRRGFPSACKTRRAGAAALLGDPAWATIERIDTDLPELITHPVMRGLNEISVNYKTLSALCAGPEIAPRIRRATVRVSRCPPAGWDLVKHSQALPALRDLTLVNLSARGRQDWTFLSGAPIIEQLDRLTVVLSPDRLSDLPLADWVALISRHPRLIELSLALGKSVPIFSLCRDFRGRVDLTMRVSSGLIEFIAISAEPVAKDIARAFSGIAPDSLGMVRVVTRSDWFPDDFVWLAGELRQMFGGAVRLPARLDGDR